MGPPSIEDEKELMKEVNNARRMLYFIFLGKTFNLIPKRFYFFAGNKSTMDSSVIMFILNIILFIQKHQTKPRTLRRHEKDAPDAQSSGIHVQVDICHEGC